VTAQYVDRIVMCLDATDNKYVRIMFLAVDSRVLETAKLDCAALRQAVLHLDDEPGAVIRCERETWQQLGDAAERAIKKLETDEFSA
jgi:hypothetical protein